MNALTFTRAAQAAPAALFLLLAVPALAEAQEGVELGMDGRLEYRLTDADNLFVLQTPVPRFRIGVPVSDRISIEPGVSLTFASQSGSSATVLLGDLSLVAHLQTEPMATRPYIRVGGILELVDFGGSSGSDTQLGVGGGIGVKVPVASQVAVRLEATASHLFESDGYQKDTRLGGLFGLSVFTR